MIKKVKKWLLMPYPFPGTIKSRIIISLSFGIFIALFLFIFKPFDFHQFKNQLFHASIYGFIITGVLLVNFFIFPYLFKTLFNSNEWKIYKMILFVLEITIFTAFLNWLTSHEGDLSLLFFMTTAFFTALFPLLIFIYTWEKINTKRHQIIAETISKNQESKISNDIKNTIIKIKGENKNEEFTLQVDTLLYINSEKNYASIFYLDKGQVKEYLLRASLNKIENQLSHFKTIIRCHKSYIVNTNMVSKIQGNARNYLLIIPELTFEIPVSRSFPKDLLTALVNK